MEKVLVIGVGVSGKGAIAFLQSMHYQVVAVDRSVKGEYLGVKILSESDVITPFDFNFVVLSPGVPSSHPLCQKAESLGIPVIGEMELGLRFLKKSNPAIAITGTNGKTTLTCLTTHTLNYVGKKARSLGNIGAPITSAIHELEEGEIVVIELSSYQLETMKERVFDVGIITNLTPDHLDRYQTMERYAKAKLNLFSCLKEGGVLYLHEEMMQEFASLIPDQKRCIPFGPFLKEHLWMDEEILMLVERLKCMVVLPTGIENILAGFLLTQGFGISATDYLEALTTFKRPRHRMEHIATVQGVEFCNDSKATNVASLSFALDTVKKPIILVMGGRSKGSPYEPLIPKMKGLVKEILTIGEAAGEIEEAFQGVIPCSRAETLSKAVEMAMQKASPGDMVLLSPACSSFDQFKNYEDRGDHFRSLVGGVV